MVVLHSLWALINIALIVVILRFWFTNFDIYSDRYGRWPAYLAFLLTIAMCSRQATERQSVNGQFTTEDSLALPDSLAFPSNGITLYDARFYSIVGYWSGSQIPGRRKLTFTTAQTGLVLGVNWQPGYTLINLTTDGHLRYSVPGSLTWWLLGIPLYTQHKLLTGEELLQPKAHRPGVHVGSKARFKQV